MILATAVACVIASPLQAQTTAPAPATSAAAPVQTAATVTTQDAAPPPAGAPNADDLARQLANPVARLISVPFQNNIDYGIGLTDTYRYTLNVQPVIPISINADWNLITRTIMPIVSAGSPAPGVEGATGFGDIVQSFFFSPMRPVGGMIIGVGPAFMYATATDDILGTGKWAAGPSVVVLRQTGAVTVGTLVNHLKAFAGDDARGDVNATFLNPFFTYITRTKTTFAVSPELTYDWEGSQWIAPINFTVSQLLLVGGRPISVSAGVRTYLDAPAGGPEWGVRFGVTLLFPRR
jgi:hypothetical protein